MNETLQTLNDLKKLFPDEQACADYLYRFKWPDGYRCPLCGRHESCYDGDNKYCRCAVCGHLTSMTVGTVLEGTRISLCKWFWMIILICRQYDNVNIRSIQRTLQIKSYKTAWTMAHKIFQAMSAWDTGDRLLGLLWLHVPAGNIRKSQESEDYSELLMHNTAE